jgi:hypothetical protein
MCCPPSILTKLSDWKLHSTKFQNHNPKRVQKKSEWKSSNNKVDESFNRMPTNNSISAELAVHNYVITHLQ